MNRTAFRATLALAATLAAGSSFAAGPASFHSEAYPATAVAARDAAQPAAPATVRATKDELRHSSALNAGEAYPNVATPATARATDGKTATQAREDRAAARRAVARPAGSVDASYAG